MANFFEKTVGDFLRGPGAAFSPGSALIFDLFGGNDASRRTQIEEAGAATSSEQQLLNLLQQQVQNNPNAQVENRNRRIQEASQKAGLEQQRGATEQLQGTLAETGRLDSGIFQQGVQSIARAGGREQRALAGQLEADAGASRRQFEQDRLQAQIGISSIGQAGEQRAQAREGELDASRQALVANVANILQMLGTAAINPAGAAAGAAGQAAGQFTPQAIAQLLQLLGVGGQQQQQDQGPPLATAQPVFTPVT